MFGYFYASIVYTLTMTASSDLVSNAGCNPSCLNNPTIVFENSPKVSFSSFSCVWLRIGQVKRKNHGNKSVAITQPLQLLFGFAMNFQK